MSFPGYPKYKDSGVDWLGEVPAHWEVATLKRRFDVRLGKMLQTERTGPDDELISYLRAANIQWSGVNVSNIRQMWFTPRERLDYALETGDLLVSEGGDVGRSCLWANELEDCGFQNSVNRVRPRSGDSSRFLYYWIQSIKDKGYIDVLCNKSTIAHFTAEKVASIPVPFPPEIEQQQIALFLATESDRIDRLVAEQQRLIELLLEKRLTVISHAVAKGLNPNALMKPSGVDLLSEIPAHWELVGLTKYLASVVDYRGRTPTKVDDGVFLLTARNIRDGKIDCDASEEYIAAAEYDVVMSRGTPQVGDVVFTTEAPLGQVANLDRTDLALAQRIIKFRGQAGVVDNYFLKYWIMGSYCQANLEQLATGSTALGIKGSKVGQVRFCLPPFQEQRAIAKFLDVETTKLDALVAEAEHTIALLQERRTALISAAVTGKIDVRGLASTESVAA